MFLNKNFFLNITILLLFLLIAGGLSIYLGFDWDWDTANYHLYNPYALLNNRINLDIMPASIMTYYNPVLDLLYYFAIKYLNNFPYLTAILFGMSYGLLLFMIFQISQVIFKSCKQSFFFSVLSTIVGGSALYTILSIGRQSHDILEAFFILLGIYFILKFLEKKQNFSFIFIAGLVLGCVVGFKYIYAPAAVAVLIALIIQHKIFNNFKRVLIFFIIGGIIGFLLTNGFWMYKLYITFGNPIMPQFSEFFPNAWINPQIKVQVEDANSFHYVKASDVWKLPFQKTCDYRFMLIYIIFILNILFLSLKTDYKKIEEESGINLNYADFLLIFCFFSMILLIKFFTELRYSCATAALSGILVIAYSYKFVHILLQYSPLKIKKTIALSVAIIVSFFLVFGIDLTHKKFTRRVPIAQKVLQVKNLNIPDDSIVIVFPSTGFLIPFQNPNVRYVYFPELRFLQQKIQILSDKGYANLRSIMDAHRDQIYFLTTYPPLSNKSTKNDQISQRRKLIFNELKKNYGMTDTEIEDCEYIEKIGQNKYYICKIKLD